MFSSTVCGQRLARHLVSQRCLRVLPSWPPNCPSGITTLLSRGRGWGRPISNNGAVLVKQCLEHAFYLGVAATPLRRPCDRPLAEMHGLTVREVHDACVCVSQGGRNILNALWPNVQSGYRVVGCPRFSCLSSSWMSPCTNGGF